MRCGLLLTFVMLAGCAGAARRGATCQLRETIASRGVEDGNANVRGALPFRAYYAVGAVTPARHHFTVWGRDDGSVVARVGVERNGDGSLGIEDRGTGGEGLPPGGAVPAEAAALAQELEAELRKQCRADAGWRVQYEDSYRSVAVYELIPRGGLAWHASALVTTDGELTRVRAIGDQTSGRGFSTIPRSVRWVRYPAADGHRMRLSRSALPPDLAEVLLAGARATAADDPRAPLVADAGPTLPPGFDDRVTAVVQIYGRAKKFEHQQGGQLRFRLSLADAVLRGESRATATASFAHTRFTGTATLVAARPAAADGAYREAEFEGTLAVQLDDGRGHRWERTFPAHGKIAIERDAVVAPYGLDLPGGSSPSPQHDALERTWPGDGDFVSFDSYLATGVYDDPREE